MTRPVRTSARPPVFASGVASAVRVTLDARSVRTGTLGLVARVSALSTDPVAGNDSASGSVRLSGHATLR